MLQTSLIDCVDYVVLYGDTYSYNEWIIARSVEVVRNKVSVDDGSFVPGQYRVNPYFVEQGEMDANGYVEATSPYPPYPGAYYFGSRGGDVFHDGLKDLNTSPFQDSATLKKRALQTAYSRVGKADLALGESIGELRETVEMLRHPLKSLRDFLSNDGFKRIKRMRKLAQYGHKAVFKDGKTAADTWLEIRYGLRPLLLTVRDVLLKAMEAERKLFDPSVIRSAHAELSDENRYSHTVNSDQNGVNVLTTAQVLDTQRVYASVQYTQTRPPTGAEDYGVSLANLPEVVWELTRMSFVVDWIYSIGPWLGSLRISPHITVLGNTVGVRESRSAEIVSAEAKYNTAIGQWMPQEPTGSMKIERYTRDTNVDFTVLPQFTAGDVMDLFRSIDSLALMWQRLK